MNENKLKNFLRKWLAPRDDLANNIFEMDLNKCFED